MPQSPLTGQFYRKADIKGLVSLQFIRPWYFLYSATGLRRFKCCCFLMPQLHHKIINISKDEQILIIWHVLFFSKPNISSTSLQQFLPLLFSRYSVQSVENIFKLEMALQVLYIGRTKNSKSFLRTPFSLDKSFIRLSRFRVHSKRLDEAQHILKKYKRKKQQFSRMSFALLTVFLQIIFGMVCMQVCVR